MVFARLDLEIEIKNESGGELFTLIPGVYSRIDFELKLKSEVDPKDTSSITLKLKSDSKFVLLGDEIVITPSQSTVYTSFVGIKCGVELDEGEAALRFVVSSSSAAGYTVGTSIPSVKISDVKAKIDLQLLMNEVPSKSYDLFKLNKEIRNIEEIKINPKQIDGQNELDFTPIRLKPYGERDELGEDNTFNHGVLFDFPFGTKKMFETLSKFSFNLEIETKCFELEKEKFELNFRKEGPVTIDAAVKQALTFNTENYSPKFDLSSNLQIKTVIPVAPVLLSCEVRADTEFNTNDKDTLKSDSDSDSKIYKAVIETAGQIDIKLDNLNINTEYFAKCTISNTNWVDDLREKIAVTIGNFKEADIIKKLIPARNENKVSHCLRLGFKNFAIAEIFKLVAPKICEISMTQFDPILARILGTVTCEVTDGPSLTVPELTLCIGPSLVSSLSELIVKGAEDNYNKALEAFKKQLKNASEVFAKYGININIDILNDYTDNDPIDIGKVSVVLKDTTTLLEQEFNFEVTSTNTQPIECYYNPVMTADYSKFLNIIQKSVVLYPGKKTTIKSVLGAQTLIKGLYSLYFQCFNLPGFSSRFQSTQKEVMYTYYNEGGSIKKMVIPEIKPIEINCDENRNKLNPKCIHERIHYIIDKLSTDIPAFIAEVQAQAEKFSRLAKEAQKKILQKLDEEFQKALKAKDEFKALLEKAIELAKYLTYTDCSIYVDGSTNAEDQTIKAEAYIQCRQTKKDYMKKLIEFLKENSKCSTLISVLTLDKIADMTYEERIKYILFLVNEISNNPDAMEEKSSEILIEVVNCLQTEFNTYWPVVEKYLNETKGYIKESILAVKRDISNLILETITNLVNILHFEEIDGYIKAADQKIKDYGIMIYDKGLQLQKQIIEAAKRLNEFGNGTYDLSLNAVVDVKVNNGGLDAKADAEISVFDLEEKGIKILTNANFMLRDKKAYAMQTLVFQSPLFSVKASGQEEGDSDSLSTFISITLYDKNGKEITVDDIKEKFRPQILYLKSRYEQLKSCFFYNEEKNQLEEGGLEIAEDFTYDGKQYFKCVASHLTSFTAGKEGESKWWVILLIILAILIVLAVVAVAFIMIRKKRNETNVDFNSKDGLINSS